MSEIHFSIKKYNDINVLFYHSPLAHIAHMCVRLFKYKDVA